MKSNADKTNENKSQAVANSLTNQERNSISTFQFIDNRSEAIAQRKLQEMANNSLQVSQLKAIQEMASNSLQVKQLRAFQSSVNNCNAQNVIQLFDVTTSSGKTYTFTDPKNHSFTTTSALQATQPIPHGSAKKETGRPANDGVEENDVGSYHYVQHLGKVGDGLTGDHQPSGAALKEAIRQKLHASLSQVLTRLMAKNAYDKAIVVVVTEAWHKTYSRTYGGRNSKAQIANDAIDLAQASMEDWEKVVPELEKKGLSETEMQEIWNELCTARETFFNSGDAQAGTLR